MKLILFKRFTKLSLARAAFWLATGVGLLIMPELGFLLNGAFYALIGCLLVNAVLRAVFFVRGTNMERGRDSKAERICRYIGLAVTVLFAAAAVHLIIFREWLSEFTPAFWGGLLALEGILYFAIALCAATAPQKFLLVILSAAVFLGAVLALGFIFGFGAGGVLGMATVLGIALLFAFLFEITAFFIRRRRMYK